MLSNLFDSTPKGGFLNKRAGEKKSQMAGFEIPKGGFYFPKRRFSKSQWAGFSQPNGRQKIQSFHYQFEDFFEKMADFEKVI